jgi:hypothetical protein
MTERQQTQGKLLLAINSQQLVHIGFAVSLSP